MRYGDRTDWNMVRLTALMVGKGRFVGVRGFLAQWLPFFVGLTILAVLLVCSNYRRIAESV
jgi:hypothetical protein